MGQVTLSLVWRQLPMAAMTDPRLMSEAEQWALVRRLREVGYRDFFEEERCDPYKTALLRLRAAGFELF